jgi:glutamate racemase
MVQLPHEDFVYFADSARLPYGPRPRREIEAFSLEVAEELLARRDQAARGRLQHAPRRPRCRRCASG